MFLSDAQLLPFPTCRISRIISETVKSVCYFGRWSVWRDGWTSCTTYKMHIPSGTGSTSSP